MKCCLLISFIFIFFCTEAQKKNSFDSTADVANYIAAHYRDEDGKMLAAYTWVTLNIKYSPDRALAINRGLDSRAVVDVAFKRRKGVCENFAAIFADICRKMGFESVVINGYTKQYNSVNRDGHSWAAVKTNSDWFLYDPTWDVGKSSGFNYYKISGKGFISTHIPFDPLWQMLEHPVSYQQFERGYFNSKKDVFSYKDSINAYLAADSLTRYAGAVARMENAGIHNSLTDLHYRVAKSDLEIQREEEQMMYYNKATGLLNDATARLNQFINFRNQQFKPVVTDDEIKRMLDGIEEKIGLAVTYFDKVNSSDAVLVYSTEPAMEQTKRLQRALYQQQEFLKEYFATTMNERHFLFYQQQE